MMLHEIISAFTLLYNQPSVTPSSFSLLLTVDSQDWAKMLIASQCHQHQESIPSPFMLSYLYTTPVFFPTTVNKTNVVCMFSWILMQLYKKHCCLSVCFKTLYKFAHTKSYSGSFLFLIAVYVVICISSLFILNVAWCSKVYKHHISLFSIPQVMDVLIPLHPQACPIMFPAGLQSCGYLIWLSTAKLLSRMVAPVYTPSSSAGGSLLSNVPTKFYIILLSIFSILTEYKLVFHSI